MKKFVKWIGIFIGLLFLLTVLITVSLVTFVSPNRFKPLFAEKIKEYTGRQVIMDGDLSWAIFPSIGLKTGHVALKNPEGFDQGIFAEVKDATISLKLLPLLRKQVESDGIKLDGLRLHLVKNAQGQVNWDFKTANADQSTTSSQSSEGDQSAVLPSLAILGLTISNSEITWRDEQQKKYISLEKLNFNAKNINLLKPFPISADFILIDNAANTKNTLHFSTDVSLNVAAKIFSFRNLEVKSRLQKNKQTFNILITSDILADLAKQTLECENIKLTSGKLALTGKINVANLSQNPETSGHLELASFDMRSWLKDVGFDVSSLQLLEGVKGQFDFIPMQNTFALQGKLSIGKLKTNNILLSSIIFPVKYQQAVVTSSAFDASFYKGRVGGNMQADLNSALPKLDLSLTLSHFDTLSLLQDLSPHQKLTLAGDGNLALHISTVGNEKNSLLHNLNGTGNMAIGEGELRGVDINYIIARATALANKQDASFANTDKTKFSDLKASFVIKNGVVSNNDLLMSSTEFSTKGQGNIDLPQQRIEYHLQVLLTQTSLENKQKALNLYGLPIPVLISGDLKNPAIRLDQDALAKELATQQVQKVRSQLQEKIEKGKIPEKAGKFLQHILGH